MAARGRKKSTASNIQIQRLSQDSQDSQGTQNSNDTLLSSQNSQNSKIKTKNYSQAEQEALSRCTEKFHAIISKNSNHDKDKAEKQRAWENIKISFDNYCKSEGIYVSLN